MTLPISPTIVEIILFIIYHDNKNMQGEERCIDFKNVLIYYNL